MKSLTKTKPYEKILDWAQASPLCNISPRYGINVKFYSRLLIFQIFVLNFLIVITELFVVNWLVIDN